MTNAQNRSNPAQQQAERRVKRLVESVQQADSAILSDAAKADLVGWINFMAYAPDSTTLMKWYFPFHGILGFYDSELQSRIDSAKIRRDRFAALARRALQAERSGKVTEGEAKSAAVLDANYVAVVEEIIQLEKLQRFLEAMRFGFDADLIEAYGNNQRLEMRQDQNH